ncbi:TetR family transcriptional regulator [Metarhizobium album]|uniref:TetR family transcriptional regulator n=1 Tax=Metarhizobium album TaxID=2182425 RepID=A0A2U2DJP7_9HYPH|nr:TetR family transcriptional regulator [Rhizobium album]PWE53547.1 TetR family transcriptional regulator [Rhizobium album]
MRRTKAEAAETRAAILVAAERMFFEKGVANSTLENIATAAGVTRGAIYWHFASKTDLFLELYNTARLPELSMMDLEKVGVEGVDALNFIEHALYEWIDLLADDIPRQRMWTILIRTNFTEELERVATAMQAIEDSQTELLVAIFERAASTGRLSPAWTPELASLTLKWHAKGMCWEWLLEGQKFDIRTLGRQSVGKLFDAFRA